MLWQLLVTKWYLTKVTPKLYTDTMYCFMQTCTIVMLKEQIEAIP